MTDFRVEGVRLAGVASTTPERTLGADDVSGRFGPTEAAKIISSTGVRRRRVAAAGQCASDLCHAAAAQLLDAMGWERESISVLIFVSQSPDYFMPATACVLHDRLGLPTTCAAFDINLGCSGYPYGLAVAAQMARGAPGRRVLLLVGDTITKMLDPGDQATAPLFGDAGSATALEACPSAPPMWFSLGTDGSGRDALIVREGAFRNPASPGASAGRRWLRMDGAEVFRFALSEVPKVYRRTLAAAQWSADDVDAAVMHQSNRFMLEHFRKRLKLPAERFVIGLENYGNTSCASIPLAISDAWGGDAGLSKKLLLVGFGVGWSWGGAAVECRDACVPPVSVLPESAVQPDGEAA